MTPAIGSQFYPEETFAFFLVPVFLCAVSLKAVFHQSLKTGIFLTLPMIPLTLIQLSQAPSTAMVLTDSLVVFGLSAWYRELWTFLRRLSETIANSWHEWIFGKIRIINHGFYVGFGAFFGVITAGILAGREYAWGILVFSVIVTVCAGLWAQIIEGSDKLKRPFGYYGGLVGILAGSPVIWWMGLNVWVVIGTASVVMPWVQAMGRLRCLVNGCCHGSRTENPLIGIRYFHPRSRVCNISGLKGELVHPTQLYAILWLTVTGFNLFSLWQHRLPPSFILGIYLIITGLGRFVEEAFRGEIQTRVIRGLRLYQWTAVISILTGIGMTMLHTTPVSTVAAFNLPTLWAAIITGLFVFFAMGVDFPQSDVRFSRLV
jgi:prolipoprotein diacylglyceryltransferase